MPIASLLLALQAAPAVPPAAPPCRAAQLRLSVDGKDGDFNGMSHSGTELSIRNLGPDCTLPALPTVELLDRRGRKLPATRRPLVGMHPGPVMLPVRIAGSHRAATDLRWVSGPVYSSNRKISVGGVRVRADGVTLRTPLTAVIYGEAAKPVQFDQTPLRAMEGMAEG